RAAHHLDPAHARHAHVEERDRGMALGDLLERFLAAARLRDDVDAALPEEPGQRRDDSWVIVGDEARKAFRHQAALLPTRTARSASSTAGSYCVPRPSSTLRSASSTVIALR